MAIYSKTLLPYIWKEMFDLNLSISFTPSFTASYCYSEPMEAVKVKKIYFYQAETNADYVIDFTTQIYGKNVKTSEWDVLCSKKYSNVPVGDWSNSATLDVSKELQNNEYSQFRMNTKDSKRAIRYEIKLVEYSKKVSASGENEFVEATVVATNGYVKTKNGAKKLKSVILNTEDGPKTIFRG